MGEKLEKLSPEQEELMLQVRDEWLNYIFSCENKLNKEKAQKGIEWMYKLSGLKKPFILWLSSPAALQVGANIFKNNQVWDQVRAQVWDQVRAQVWDQVGDQVEAQVRAQVGDQVEAQVWAQVRAQVEAQVWDQVEAQVRAQVGDQVWDQVRAQVRNQVGAQVWAQVGAQVWDQVEAQVRAQVGDQVGDQVWAQVEAQVWDQVEAQVRAHVGDQVRNQVWDQVRNQVWAQVRDQVEAQVRDQVGDQVWAQVEAQVWDQVRNQVWAQVWDQVGAQVWDQVGDQVMDQVRAQVGAQVRNQVWAQVWDQVGAQVWDQVGDQVMDQVGDQVRAQVGAQVWDQVGAQVWDQVGDQVMDQVGDQVRAQVGDQVMDQVEAQVRDQELKFYDFTPYGSVRSYGWVAFYDFFNRIGIKGTDPIKPMKNLLRSGVYDMIVLDGLCLVSEMPNRISRDNNLLHHESKAAIEWPDGYKQYYWKGVAVPQKLIETPDKITKEDLKQNQNAEVRRCFIEKLGVSKYFAILSGGEGLSIIDQDTDEQGHPMKLMSFDFEGETIQVLEVTCPSTERVYNLYPPNQNSRNVWGAKADTFKGNNLTYRHGDVGLVKVGSESLERPLIET